MALLSRIQGHWPLAIVYVAYLLPSAVTLLMRRAALRRFWRFAVPFLLIQVTLPGDQLLVFLAAEAWVLHQSWVVEVRTSEARTERNRDAD